jgi:integrase
MSNSKTPLKRVRRSVAKDVKRFVGYRKLIELCNSLRLGRDRALFAALFLTGGRVSEVLALEKKNFEINRDFVIVKDMALIKRYKKLFGWVEYVKAPPENSLKRLYKYSKKIKGDKKFWRQRYKTEITPDTRADFSFPASEPLANILIAWLAEHDDKLFPHCKRFRAWQILNEIGIYPHWLRAQRASSLISFHNFNMEEMMEWLSWVELSTAMRYGHMGVHKLSSKFRTDFTRYRPARQVG